MNKDYAKTVLAEAYFKAYGEDLFPSVKAEKSATPEIKKELKGILKSNNSVISIPTITKK